MKKTAIKLMSGALIIICLLSVNSIFAKTASLEFPDGEKPAKKETVKAGNNVTGTKTSTAKVEIAEPVQIVLEKSAAEEDFDSDNPTNNADCTKAGFDRE